MYSRVPNIPGVPNKSERGFFYPTLLNKIGGDLISMKFQIKTCKREKIWKKSKIRPRLDINGYKKKNKKMKKKLEIKE